jgi:hypothetical protein
LGDALQAILDYTQNPTTRNRNSNDSSGLPAAMNNPDDDSVSVTHFSQFSRGGANGQDTAAADTAQEAFGRVSRMPALLFLQQADQATERKLSLSFDLAAKDDTAGAPAEGGAFAPNRFDQGYERESPFSAMDVS